MSRRKGFTLTELLVIIAIMVILAAVLFPVFSRARAKARQTTCLNNLKQLALGVMMYASSWDGGAPSVEHPWAAFSGGAWPRNEYVLWSVLIDPYVRDRSSYACPSRPDWCLAGAWNLVEPCAYGVPVPSDWAGVSMGYAMNPLIQLSVPIPYETPDTSSSWFDWESVAAGTMHPSTGYGGQNFARLERPAEVMMLSDANNIADNCGNKLNYAGICGSDRTPCIDDDPSNFTAGDARHRGGNNIAFCDGHAEWVRSEIYMCLGEGTGADEADILSGNSMQRLHGIDQLR
ncbi:MAG: DUF1559 domain-containing protein [Armatimonadetes bacterium]|nr:DUF1559 domain-containing protein [Armatimonadota bacterium]NIM24102.1 DUF1559 domain-containing protein [Armatimonadota bacterium]NIM67956.1 DUF1559 domain-containing protein [Armatimonadota bacterium]NIM76478.1 DUF1559 domain-containing protein [Armatimonadota bacterium]NIN06186.1 DUF1559 domain-containing protein [Armatimonadota bacterium]